MGAKVGLMKLTLSFICASAISHAKMKVVFYQGLCFLGDQYEQPEKVGAWSKQLRSQHKIETRSIGCTHYLQIENIYSYTL